MIHMFVQVSLIYWECAASSSASTSDLSGCRRNTSSTALPRCPQALLWKSSEADGRVGWQAARARPSGCAKARFSGSLCRRTGADLDRAGKPIGHGPDALPGADKRQRELQGVAQCACVQPAVERVGLHRSAMSARLSVNHRQLDAASQALIAKSDHTDQR